MTNSLSMFEMLAARGDLLEYIELLGGVVNTDISLNDGGSVTMTVNQVKQHDLRKNKKRDR